MEIESSWKPQRRLTPSESRWSIFDKICGGALIILFVLTAARIVTQSE